MHPNILHKQLIDPTPTTAQSLPTPLRSAGGGVRQRWLKMATGDVDRAGDILALDGMDATNFLKNPQFLWQHGTSGSIINTIGRVLELKSSNNALYALVEYAAPEISPLAEQVLQLHDAGMLPANSIGFRPVEYEANDFGGFTFTEWELIECSKVELPMNPEAVDTDKSLLSDDEIEEAIENTLGWLLS